MMISGKKKKLIIQILAVLFWIAIWQLLSMQRVLGIFLASPLDTAVRFFRLCGEGLFWRSILYTSVRILTGFLAAVAIGSVLAVLAGIFAWADDLIQPPMRLVRAVPVVSFIILALILVSSRYLTQLISFIMALPIIYMNVKTGIEQRDPALTEMARLFRVPLLRRFRFLYLHQVMPLFETGTSLALGFAWKSGIAAEVIGMPKGSIGERLQQAKVYLNTPDLFAWTLAVVLMSIVTEKLWRKCLRVIRYLSAKGC
ncbi:MAG: ABC transporter permease subunit [Lachnospiraceae bacterium]|nr:ABC transporter permease subunit [Lachnospiraceae bacterium]